MRICLLSYRGWVYCGGQGVYVHYLSRELQRLGHEVHVMVGPPFPDLAPGIPMHPIETLSPHVLYCDPYYKPANASVFSYLSPLVIYEWVAARLGMFPEPLTFSLRAYWELRRLQPKLKFDIIHDNQCLGYGLLLMKRLKVPVVATVHHPLSLDTVAYLAQARGLWEKFKWKRLYSFTGMQDRVVPRLDKIITVSATSAEHTRQAYRLPDSKLRMVYNGVDTEIFKRRDGTAPEPNRIVMVARTEDRKKGVIFLLQALKTLKDSMDVRLTIVDEKPPAISYAPSLVKEYGLEDRVTFTGRLSVEQLVAQYSSAEVAVVPSVYEGFGFPAAEAMSCEVPLISTRGGALPEVVGEDGKAGILVPPEDPAALAGAIRRLLADEQLRRELSKAGRERMVRHFTWEKAAKETLAVYEEALAC